MAQFWFVWFGCTIASNYHVVLLNFEWSKKVQSKMWSEFPVGEGFEDLGLVFFEVKRVESAAKCIMKLEMKRSNSHGDWDKALPIVAKLKPIFFCRSLHPLPCFWSSPTCDKVDITVIQKGPPQKKLVQQSIVTICLLPSPSIIDVEMRAQLRPEIRSPGPCTRGVSTD